MYKYFGEEEKRGEEEAKASGKRVDDVKRTNMELEKLRNDYNHHLDVLLVEAMEKEAAEAAKKKEEVVQPPGPVQANGPDLLDDNATLAEDQMVTDG